MNVLVTTRNLMRLIAIWVFAFLCSCHSQSPAIIPEVPTGTSASAAIEMMISQGYVCKICKNADFAANYWEGEYHSQLKKMNGIDYVECIKSTKSGTVVFFDIVALVLDDSEHISGMEVLRSSDADGS